MARAGEQSDCVHRGRGRGGGRWQGAINELVNDRKNIAKTDGQKGT